MSNKGEQRKTKRWWWAAGALLALSTGPLALVVGPHRDLLSFWPPEAWVGIVLTAGLAFLFCTVVALDRG
jgi:hypothetical protein